MLTQNKAFQSTVSEKPSHVQHTEYTDICHLISCLKTSFRIASKECHGNYVLISKEQRWRSPAKKLSEERLQGWQEKPEGKTKTSYDKPS